MRMWWGEGAQAYSKADADKHAMYSMATVLLEGWIWLAPLKLLVSAKRAEAVR